MIDTARNVASVVSGLGIMFFGLAFGYAVAADTGADPETIAFGVAVGLIAIGFGGQFILDGIDREDDADEVSGATPATDGGRVQEGDQ